MDPKQKGWLIYVAGSAGFTLFCLALAAAKCVAAELPSRLFLFPLVLYVLWVAYLSGMEFGVRKPLWKRAAMILASSVGASAVIWFCLNVIASPAAPKPPRDPDATPARLSGPSHLTLGQL